MGWYDIELTEAGAEDPVIGHFRKPAQKVFQSHGDVFDVPASATHLARSALCEGQAFRYGKNYRWIMEHGSGQVIAEREVGLLDLALEMEVNHSALEIAGQSLRVEGFSGSQDLHIGSGADPHVEIEEGLGSRKKAGRKDRHEVPLLAGTSTPPTPALGLRARSRAPARSKPLTTGATSLNISFRLTGFLRAFWTASFSSMDSSNGGSFSSQRR
jgi:hypothetical protein